MILIDNTVLSNFTLIERPEFIRLAFADELCTTHCVLDEFTKGIALGRLPVCQWEWLQIVQMTKSEERQFMRICKQLGEGEASCLAVAAQRKWRIATDDKDARKWAIRLHIPHTGTLGILGTLIVQNQLTLTEGNEWLQQMIEAGYHSPMTTLDELIRHF